MVARSKGKCVFGRMVAFPSMLLLSSATGAVEPSGWKQLGPGHFSCTEPAGQFDNYGIAALRPGTPLTVRFSMISENYDPKWTVEAAIFFDAPNGRSRVTVGKAHDDRDHIYVALQGPRYSRHEWDILAEYEVTDGWIDVNLNMNAKGILEVASGGRVGKLNLQTAEPVKTTLHCNSGVFEVQVLPPNAASAD